MDGWRFEWDEAKAEANRRKHGVSFDTAAEVLADPFADLFQLHHAQHGGGEERWFTFASHPGDRNIVFAIVWTEGRDEEGAVARLISARKATRRERKWYEEEIF